MAAAPESAHQAEPAQQLALTPELAKARRLSHPAAFAAIAGIFMVFLAASSAPSPLYVVYQREWGFATSTLTIVFAVYVFGLIGSLLVLGALSDHIGRRPVLAAAIVGEAAALVLFLLAGNVEVLLAARLVQGIATGAAMTTLGATLVDLNPPHAPGRAGMVNGLAPAIGLALGALGCGALVQFAPAPTHLIWALLLVLMALSMVVVAGMPETSVRRPGARASLAPRLGLPHRLRAEFYAMVPILIASWALGGLYLSLGPSVAAGLFGLTNHLIGGLVVTLFFGAAALTSFGLRNQPVPVALRTGAAMLIIGTALSVGAILADTVTLAVIGTVLAGIGMGASMLASFGTLARISTPAERGELFAIGYLVAYLAFSVPALIAGFATTDAGLRPITVSYAAAVIVLGLAALAAHLFRRTSAQS